MKMPAAWWDRALDGQPYAVCVPDTGYRSIQGFRDAAYQQADARFCCVATHKKDARTLYIQAWGRANRTAPDFPNLKDSTVVPTPLPVPGW